MKNLQLEWDNYMRGLCYETYSTRKEYFYGLSPQHIGFSNDEGECIFYTTSYKCYRDYYINSPKERVEGIIGILQTIRIIKDQNHKVIIILPNDNFFTKDANNLFISLSSDNYFSSFKSTIIDKSNIIARIKNGKEIFEKDIIITNDYDIIDNLKNMKCFVIDNMDRCHFVLYNNHTHEISRLSVNTAINDNYSVSLRGDIHEIMMCVEDIRRSLYISKYNGEINPPKQKEGLFQLMEELININKKSTHLPNDSSEYILDLLVDKTYTDLFTKGCLEYKLSKLILNNEFCLDVSFKSLNINEKSDEKNPVEDFDPDQKLEEIRKNLILEYENLTEKDSNNYKGRSYLASMIESFSNSIKG